jgi:prepilin-type N-terminal cleavage/methylation domain-containing protein
MKNNFESSGFTLVEVLVAMALFSIVSAIMAPSFLYQLQTNTNAELKNGAIAVTQQILDSVRAKEVSSLPTSGVSTQSISAGERNYSAKTSYCLNPSWCDNSSRHLSVDIYYRNKKVYGTETVFSQLR